MANADITAARLRELLHYDPETGFFTVKVATSNRSRKDGQPGHLHSSGYLTISLDRVRYKAHRLAWLYMTGEWPLQWVDHINGLRSDNRWANLRDVSKVVNGQNQKKAKNGSRSGFLGVIPVKGRWRAAIVVRGSTKCLGTFDVPEEAHAAYLEAKRRLHEGCTI